MKLIMHGKPLARIFGADDTSALQRGEFFFFFFVIAKSTEFPFFLPPIGSVRGNSQLPSFGLVFLHVFCFCGIGIKIVEGFLFTSHNNVHLFLLIV